MKRQFDVFANPEAARRAAAPFLIVLQSHHLQALATTVVAPLRIADQTEGIAAIQVPVIFAGEAYAVMIPELAHIPARMLARPIGSLAGYEDAIRRALDRLFSGF